MTAWQTVQTHSPEIIYDETKHQFICQGDWRVTNLAAIQPLMNMSLTDVKDLVIDGAHIEKMDSAGAWLIHHWQFQLNQRGISSRLVNFSKAQQTLLDIVEKELLLETPLPQPVHLGFVASVGKLSIKQLQSFERYLSFVGALSLETIRIVVNPKHIRWSSLASVIYRTGYQALPIIALLSFMIGVVLTYQMGLQLRNYGANVYIVDLLGLAVLREFGPLLTAIMVAGRTGSAFTAQLGMMKLNQEIDALNTLSVTPGELLLLPRIVGLLIALPLLTIWADIFGIVGGMVMSNNMLKITWYDFLHRFPHVIPLRSLIIGLGKAPIFALLIASIGCYQGMNVELSATSVGQNTTRSVVSAIFFIIVADAIFSIIFSELKL